MNWTLLANSLLVGGLTTLLAGALGFAVALALAGVGTGWRHRLLLLAIVALVLPPFLVANCWIDLLGATGRWRAWLPVNIYSVGGAVWVLALLTWPSTTLFALSAWSQLDAAQLESEPALRGSALVRWLLWPVARGAVGQAAVLTFVLSLNNFAVPAVLQVKVFPAEMWLRFSTGLDERAAWAVSWPLVVAPVVLLLLLRRPKVCWPRAEGSATARAVRRQLGWAWMGGYGVLTLGLLAMSVALPLWEVAGAARTWSELPNLIRAAPDVIWNSFAFAAIAASLCVALGLVSWRAPIGLILWLPFLVPGVLLGRALTWAFNRPGWDWLYGGFGLVLLAFALRYLALGWNGTALALRAVDRDLIDAARLEGARGWALLRHAQWPQAGPQVAAAWYVTYLLCLWDVETLVLIYPPGGETLALRIFNLLHYGHHAQVNALCVLLLAVAVAPLGVWQIWSVVRSP